MLGKIWHFLFHTHQWEVIHKGHLVGNWRNVATGHYYHMRCIKCGKLKQQEFY